MSVSEPTRNAPHCQLSTPVAASPLLPHVAPCVLGAFVSRHKRFSVAMRLDGEVVAVHSNNSGSMLGLLRPGAPMLASIAPRAGRKLPYTQEALWLECIPTPHAEPLARVHAGRGFWVGVNTLVPNRMLQAAFAAQRLPFARGYTDLRREATRGHSRLDALLTAPPASGLPPLWVECKNVTLVEDDAACFPDAVTERGQRHLRELMDIVRRGGRAVMFYLVQRADGRCFAPAAAIDPEYAALFWQAVDAGVEMWPMRGVVSPAGIELGERLPLAPRGCA